MGTNNKVHSRAFAAWVRDHFYGFMQAVSFTLTGLSLIWMYFYGEPYPYDERGFFRLMSGYVPAFIFPFLCATGFFAWEGSKQFSAFVYALLGNYLLALAWCAYWGISYIIPIATAGISTLFYREIRPDDKDTKTDTIFSMVIVVWFISGFALSTFFSHLQYKEDLKVKEYTQQASEAPVVRIIDRKDDYIYTEEYGLEKMYFRSADIGKGSTAHRLPIDEKDADVFIVAE